MKWLVLFTLGLLASCGPDSGIVRDAKVYQAELDFWEQVSMQQAGDLASLVKTYCPCVEGHFPTDTCLSAASKVVLVRSRVPWHKAMALFNAGLSESRPSVTPPEVPNPETLCQEAP